MKEYYFNKSGFSNIVGTRQDANADHSVLQLQTKNGFSICGLGDGLTTEPSHFNNQQDAIFASTFGIKIDAPLGPNGEEGYYPWQPSDYPINCVSVGRYYDMPVSPNMQLTLSREMDGVDIQQTRGGSTFTNIRHTGPPNWGNYGPGFSKFIDAPTHNISRVGRRTWKLKFDMLSDDDVMGAYESINAMPYNLDAEDQEIDWTTPQDDGADITGYENPLLEEDNWYSQVFLKTLGGRIPFLFNPRGGGSSPDNSPDQFAICTIDQKSIDFRQVNHRLYQINLKIVETW